MNKIKSNKFMDRLKKSCIDAAADFESMSLISPNYFLCADKLFDLGKKDIENKKIQKDKADYLLFEHSRYFHSGIILYCTGFDIFMNENLSLSHFFINKKETNKEELEGVKKYAEGLLYERDSQKIRNFFYAYNGNKKGVNKKVDNCIERLVSLFGLRNELIHYTAEFVRNRDCPKRAINAYNHIKREYLYNLEMKWDYQCINWASFFSCMPAINWARNTVKDGLMLFAEITGAHYDIERTYHEFLDIEINDEFFLRHNINLIKH